MKLIGMLDSPYVRRVAITLKRLEIPFEHEALSVFRTFEQFQRINPVVKAPTLICDDGTVLMDSCLIIDYLEAVAGRSLLPAAPQARAHDLRLIGLALAACEKSVQIYYEYQLRPAEKRHEPWLERVRGQLAAAYGELEKELEKRPLATDGDIDQAGISLAVAWSFTQLLVAEHLDAARFPRVKAFAEYAEGLALFVSTPMV
ncbi:glutathione S-transferase [Pseudomonas chlororaphis]|uniref:glutathione S-transferase n=1 Tax=Pseudomonas chlororaphis TaxID=587753 RepID=UPI00240794FD|nr:glutathione S-transferase [Pseudomonas chlororaphis]